MKLETRSTGPRRGRRVGVTRDVACKESPFQSSVTCALHAELDFTRWLRIFHSFIFDHHLQVLSRLEFNNKFIHNETANVSSRFNLGFGPG